MRKNIILSAWDDLRTEILNASELLLDGHPDFPRIKNIQKTAHPLVFFIRDEGKSEIVNYSRLLQNNLGEKWPHTQSGHNALSMATKSNSLYLAMEAFSKSLELYPAISRNASHINAVPMIIRLELKKWTKSDSGTEIEFKYTPIFGGGTITGSEGCPELKLVSSSLSKRIDFLESAFQDKGSKVFSTERIGIDADTQEAAILLENAFEREITMRKKHDITF